MADTPTRAEKNKRIRQEALREQLSAQGHVQHAVDIINKLSDRSLEIDREMVARFKIAIDGHFKLIDKYLPTEKPTTIEGSDGGAVLLKWQE